jgi:hypothetical protein
LDADAVAVADGVVLVATSGFVDADVVCVCELVCWVGGFCAPPFADATDDALADGDEMGASVAIVMLDAVAEALGETATADALGASVGEATATEGERERYS